MALALTAEQQQVVEWDGGPLRVLAPAGSGKTTALVHRHLRLAARSQAGRVLVLTANRGAAARFLRAVLPHLRGGFDALPITTPWGLAFDVVSRHEGPVQLLSGAEQRALVRELLEAEAGDRRLWPGLHPLVGKRAFAEEVAKAVLHAQELSKSPDELRHADGSAEQRRRWAELARFLQGYLHTLHARQMVDSVGLLARACALLLDSDVAGGLRARHPHVLVDDFESAGPAVARLVCHLAGVQGDVTAAANPEAAPGGTPEPDGPQRFPAVHEVRLERSFRRPAPPELVRCQHPSLEPDAVAGELLAAHERGVPWEAMAVLVRHSHRQGPALVRALARQGIPVTAAAGPLLQEPAVRSLVDLLRWVEGDEQAVERLLTSPLAGLDPSKVRGVRREARARSIPLEAHPALAPLVAVRAALVERAPIDDVATLAHHAFRLALAHLVHEPGEEGSNGDDRALDAVVAFLDGLGRLVERRPGARLSDYLALLEGSVPSSDARAAEPPPGPAVTVTSLSAAAGREWHTVVVVGCVEGELPRLRQGLRFFDGEVLLEAPRTAPERGRATLEAERRLFRLGCSRATDVLVGTAAPEPGVLVSRFVEAWPERPRRLPLEPPVVLATPPPTAGLRPLWPDGVLRLSASQLDTLEDCPLKHTYRYALGVRPETGLHAGLGSLVHRVLERFLDPAGPPERTLERLHRIAEECWRDDLAPYRPQLEEARRDLFDMLDLWWEREGGLGDAAPVVLATEHPFEVGVGPHRVTGRIDRVDRADDGAGTRVVDYKTGKSRPRPTDVAEDLQLATYHLAATLDPELAAWGPPTQLRPLHLRTMTPYDQEIRPDHAATTEGRILTAAERIMAEEVAPAVDADCDRCDLHRLCPLWPQGREVQP